MRVYHKAVSVKAKYMRGGWEHGGDACRIPMLGNTNDIKQTLDNFLNHLVTGIITGYPCSPASTAARSPVHPLPHRTARQLRQCHWMLLLLVSVDLQGSSCASRRWAGKGPVGMSVDLPFSFLPLMTPTSTQSSVLVDLSHSSNTGFLMVIIKPFGLSTETNWHIKCSLHIVKKNNDPFISNAHYNSSSQAWY